MHLDVTDLNPFSLPILIIDYCCDYVEVLTIAVAESEGFFLL